MSLIHNDLDLDQQTFDTLFILLSLILLVVTPTGQHVAMHPAGKARTQGWLRRSSFAGINSACGMFTADEMAKRLFRFTRKLCNRVSIKVDWFGQRHRAEDNW